MANLIYEFSVRLSARDAMFQFLNNKLGRNLDFFLILQRKENLFEIFSQFGSISSAKLDIWIIVNCYVCSCLLLR